MALRKLWTSDPVLSNTDGLIDYDPDRLKFLNNVEKVARDLFADRRAEAQVAAVAAGRKAPRETKPRKKLIDRTDAGRAAAAGGGTASGGTRETTDDEGPAAAAPGDGSIGDRAFGGRT